MITWFLDDGREVVAGWSITLGYFYDELDPVSHEYLECYSDLTLEQFRQLVKDESRVQAVLDARKVGVGVVKKKEIKMETKVLMELLLKDCEQSLKDGAEFSEGMWAAYLEGKLSVLKLLMGKNPTRDLYAEQDARCNRVSVEVSSKEPPRMEPEY